MTMIGGFPSPIITEKEKNTMENKELQATRDRAAIDLLKHMMKVAYATEKTSISLMDLNNIVIVAENKAIDMKMREVEVI